MRIVVESVPRLRLVVGRVVVLARLVASLGRFWPPITPAPAAPSAPAAATTGAIFRRLASVAAGFAGFGRLGGEFFDDFGVDDLFTLEVGAELVNRFVGIVEDRLATGCGSPRRFVAPWPAFRAVRAAIVRSAVVGAAASAGPTAAVRSARPLRGPGGGRGTLFVRGTLGARLAHGFGHALGSRWTLRRCGCCCRLDLAGLKPQVRGQLRPICRRGTARWPEPVWPVSDAKQGERIAAEEPVRPVWLQLLVFPPGNSNDRCYSQPRNTSFSIRLRGSMQPLSIRARGRSEKPSASCRNRGRTGRGAGDPEAEDARRGGLFGPEPMVLPAPEALCAASDF